MNQSRVESIIERTVDMASGFIISWLVYEYYILPSIETMSATKVVSIFTVISFFRGLIWRRFFNRGLHRVVHKLVKRLYKWEYN